MRHFKQIFALFLLFIFFKASAQNADNEITYNNAPMVSQTTLSGTARFQSIGGATTALGADMGTLGSNPAGLGMYRKSDMSITGGLGHVGTNAAYQQNDPTSIKTGKTYAFLPNAGMVFTSQNADSNSSWKGSAFGLSYNRISDYQQKFSYTGTNNNSLADYMVNKANGSSAYNYFNNAVNSPTGLTSLGGAAYLFAAQNPQDMNSSQYYSLGNDQDSNSVMHKETVTTTGHQAQWDAGYGANINDKFYFGFGMGVSTLKYVLNRSYQESFSEPTSQDALENYALGEKLTLKGTGVNFKFGATYKAADWIRVGATLQTPTWYAMKATYNYTLDANFLNAPGNPVFPDTTESNNTKQIVFDYKLRTPLKFTVGMALFSGKGGFLSSDLSIVSYNTAKFSSSSYDFTAYNSAIKQNTRTTINYNIGGEVRKNTMRFRAGFAYYGSPYKSSVGTETSTINYTVGFGLRFRANYIDFAIVDARYTTHYSPYTPPSGVAPMDVKVTTSAARLVITTGLLF